MSMYKKKVITDEINHLNIESSGDELKISFKLSSGFWHSRFAITNNSIFHCLGHTMVIVEVFYLAR